MTALMYTWTGDVMDPLGSHRRLARAAFKVGAVYRLGLMEVRSWNSHKHFFAQVADAWNTMPEGSPWTTPDELRLWALTYTEFRDVREYVARSEGEALRFAAFQKDASGYCRIEIEGTTVTVYTPRSQAVSEMSAREFQRSKEAVFGVLAEKLGITVEELKANAGTAA
jgi:hypothetical protein